MSQLLGNISKIIKSSVIDGPGNRMVIFFQGCNLNCIYCHNSHTIGICDLCGICVKECPTNSLEIKSEGYIKVNESNCIKCDRCLEVCPKNSSPFYKKMSVLDLISEIVEVKDFISGITVSGGEVMLQSEFLVELFSEIKKDEELKKLSILVDTNGNVLRQKWDSLIHLVDGFMLDIKSFSSEIHKKITGYGNEKILDSIKYLDKKGKIEGVRFVIVPGYNDSDEEIGDIAKYMATLSPNIMKIVIRMRKHGIRKEYNYLVEPTEKDTERIRKIFMKYKVNIVMV